MEFRAEQSASWARQLHYWWYSQNTWDHASVEDKGEFMRVAEMVLRELNAWQDRKARGE